MADEEWAVLLDESGKTFVVEWVDRQEKIKGLGVFNPVQTLANIGIGEKVMIGQKEVRRLSPRLPELSQGMTRRAQTIGSKDAGLLVARLGLGPGDAVLEAGIGSAGLSLYIARVLGNSGTHITVEPREEHASVGLENMQRARASWSEFPQHHHLEGRIEEIVPSISSIAATVDAIVLDLPDHPQIGRAHV